jgi:hypothetical protein
MKVIKIHSKLIVLYFGIFIIMREQINGMYLSNNFSQNGAIKSSDTSLTSESLPTFQKSYSNQPSSK